MFLRDGVFVFFVVLVLVFVFFFVFDLRRFFSQGEKPPFSFGCILGCFLGFFLNGGFFTVCAVFAFHAQMYAVSGVFFFPLRGGVRGIPFFLFVLSL